MHFLAKSTAFSPTQKALHWTVVVLLILQEFVFDSGMGKYFHAHADGKPGAYTTTSVIHILIGCTVLLLAAWRLGLRATHGTPPAPEGKPMIFAMLSELAHIALYLLLFIIPLTGLIAWVFKYDPLTDVHSLLTNLLLVLVGIHVAAVAVHQFFWKTKLISRMI
jgi:cytochrome b561